jgi:hypothetical protein
MKRAFIIHGWGGNSKEGWFPWLKSELEKRGFKVYVPNMPDPECPKIKAWISCLKKLVGKADKDTYFVGHSIGCQAILRYLETLPKTAKVGGAVFVAGWTHLKIDAIEDEEPGSSKIAMPWIKKKISWNKILKHSKKFISIFSDNDPFVYLTDSKIFRNKLRSKIIVQHNKGHFSGSSGVKKLPIALKSVTELS